MSVVIEGRGLHTGAPARLVLARCDGPATLCGAPVRELRAASADRATRVSLPGRSVLTVEHLFAAMAGLGLHEGVAIELDGPEIPLADGRARAFVTALASLDIAPCVPPSRVVKNGVIAVGASTYVFERGHGARVDVAMSFDDARLAREASWRGDAKDFADRIAPARTFAFARDVEELAARGLATHVAPESVVVIAEDGLLSAGDPAAWDEPVRHKLLDLIGDLFLYGGPPVGAVRATNPGHFVTHAVMRAAIAEGLVAISTPRA